MGADGATGVVFREEIQLAVLEKPLLEAHLEALRSEGDSRHVLEAGQRMSLGHRHVEAVQERREEQEQLHAG